MLQMKVEEMQAGLNVLYKSNCPPFFGFFFSSRCPLQFYHNAREKQNTNIAREIQNRLSDIITCYYKPACPEKKITTSLTSSKVLNILFSHTYSFISRVFYERCA